MKNYLPDMFLAVVSVTGTYTILDWIIRCLVDYTPSPLSIVLLYVASGMIIYKICTTPGGGNDPH